MRDSRRRFYGLTEYTGCFGRFRPADVICRGHCAVCIRCAIETEHTSRQAVLDDLFEEDDMFLNIQ
jgi:hypothetical protein